MISFETKQYNIYSPSESTGTKKIEINCKEKEITNDVVKVLNLQ